MVAAWSVARRAGAGVGGGCGRLPDALSEVARGPLGGSTRKQRLEGRDGSSRCGRLLGCATDPTPGPSGRSEPADRGLERMALPTCQAP
jgi:hypothetical protein